MKLPKLLTIAGLMSLCSGCLLLFPGDTGFLLDPLTVRCQLPKGVSATHVLLGKFPDEAVFDDTVTALLEVNDVQCLSEDFTIRLAEVDSTGPFECELPPYPAFKSGPVIELIVSPPKHEEIILICWKTGPEPEIVRIDLGKKTPAKRYDHLRSKFVKAQNVTWDLVEGKHRVLEVKID